jgi:hypothetical protein
MPVVLHVVVTIEDVVLPVVLVLYGDGHLRKAFLHCSPGTVASWIGVATPGDVDRRRV